MRQLLTILCLCFLLTPSMLNAQKSLVRQGDKNFASHNFVKAAQQWKTAFDRSPAPEDRQLLAFRIATAYHRMNRFEDALQWYDDAIGEEPSRIEWLLAKADAALRAGKTELARTSAEQARRLNPRSAEAALLLESLRLNSLVEGINYPVIHPGTGINSNFTDYAPAWFNSDLIISSSRPIMEGKTSDGRTNEDFSRLYLFISNLYGDFGQAIELPVSSNNNAGVFTFDKQRNIIYFTRCNNRKNICTIMQSDFDPLSFRFSKPRRVAFAQRKYNYGHPHITEDGRKMYFTARLPGGYGGNDIYSITIKSDGSWGLPVNLGQAVNTAFDELFPTTAGDSLLFFSSYGHTGYGGLDILYSFDRGGGFSEVGVLPPPFNSSSDDFSLSMQPGTLKGVFASGRNRGSGDDIFFFDDYPVRKIIMGTTKNTPMKQAIADATISAKDGTKDIVTKSRTDGNFTLSLSLHLKGSVEASHPDFVASRKQLPYPTGSILQQFDFELQNRMFDLTLKGKVSHRETGKAITDQAISLFNSEGRELVKVRSDLQGVFMFDRIAAENIYTLRVEREGFFKESRVINVPSFDRNTILQKSNGYDLDFALTPIVLKKEIVLNDIYYDFDRASLRESSKYELGKLVQLLRDNPEIRIQISSHTDTRGTDRYNDQLSSNRAAAVVDYLEASGIASQRLVSKGFGKRQPVIRNARTEAEHQANRRTTFQVLDRNAAVTQIHQSPIVRQPNPNNARLVYRVQLLVSSSRRNAERDFAPLRQLVDNISFYEFTTGELYRYEVGNRYSFAEAEALRNRIRTAGFPDSFIVPYIDNQRVTIQQARDFRP